MKKSVTMVVAMAMFATPAFAQIRPEDCRPVLPVVDRAAAAVPQDVVTEPAAPQIAAKRRFLGLPFLLPALLAAGGCAAFCGGGGGNDSTPPVSPA